MKAIKLENGYYFVNIDGLVLRTHDGVHFETGYDTSFFDAESNGLGVVAEYNDGAKFAAEMRKLVLSNSEMRRKAEELAEAAHHGQLDKAGKPYFEAHLTPVAEHAYAQERDYEVATVAYLHDILEDTDVTEETLREQFPDHIVDAVVALTRKQFEPYMAYLLNVKCNPLARKVKLYDLANNMDLSRIKHPTEEDEKRTLKYAKAYAFLMS